MSRDPRSRRRAGLPAAVAAAGALCLPGLAATPAAQARATPAAQARATPGTVTAAPGNAWTVYHGDPAGSGVATSPASVGTGRRAWTSPRLDGDLYGEPLVSGGLVYVATERDTVYALSAATGAVAWSRHLATPVPASRLPCGDIGPTVGITGTPVIDPARGEIYVVADELVNGTPAHVLTGLATADGTVRTRVNVDPPGADPAALLQRTGLNLAGGRVVFGFGGNDGDCPPYRGRVVSVPEAGGPPAIFTVDGRPGQAQGAVWMGGGAPAVDGAGHVWVTAGNGSVYKTSRGYDYSDSVLELSPGMRLLHFFAPDTWASDNASDQDMSTEPALLAGGQLLAAGKQRKAYLLSGAALGGIGGQQATLAGVCADSVDGGMAVTGQTVYLPCLAGPVAVRVRTSPPGLTRLWAAQAGGGPPIVAAGLVWTISRTGTLYGLDPGNGAVRQQAVIGEPANHFATPAAAGGLLLATSADQVIAFGTGPPGTAAPGEPGAAPAAGGGGLPGAAVAGIVAGVVLLLGGAGWAVWRRHAAARAPGS